MRLEGASICQAVREISGGWDADGLGLTGLLLDEPRQLTIPIMLCFIGESDDTEGASCSFAYRVTAPADNIMQHGVSAVGRDIGTAPQLVDPERYLIPLWLDFHVDQDGVYVVDIEAERGTSLRLPLRVALGPQW